VDEGSLVAVAVLEAGLAEAKQLLPEFKEEYYQNELDALQKVRWFLSIFPDFCGKFSDPRQ
jgi:hypothetical protein